MCDVLGTDVVRRDIDVVKELTNRNFAVNPIAPIENEWKQAIAAAQSEDAVKFHVFNDIH